MNRVRTKMNLELLAKMIRKLPKLTRAVSAILFILILLREIRLGFFRDSGRRLKGLHFKQYLAPFLFILFTVLISVLWFDAWASVAVPGWHHFILHVVVGLGRNLGRNIWLYLEIVYLVGWIKKKESWCQVSFGMLLSTALAGLASALFKVVFLRPRPEFNLGPFAFFHLRGLLQGDNGFQSFPSGDVATVTAATAFLIFVVRSPWIKGLLLLIPACVIFSRLSLLRHWLSDTLFAFGISFMVAHLVWQYRKLCPLSNDKQR